MMNVAIKGNLTSVILIRQVVMSLSLAPDALAQASSRSVNYIQHIVSYVQLMTASTALCRKESECDESITPDSNRKLH
jgi:hypothetical protein